MEIRRTGKSAYVYHEKYAVTYCAMFIMPVDRVQSLNVHFIL